MAATGYILPAEADLVALIGADFSTTVQLFSDDAQTTAFDLSGYTAKLTIGNLFTLTAGAGLTIATPTNGTIVAVLTHAQTATVAPNMGRPHYNLQLTDASGNVSYPLSGELLFRLP